MIRRLCWQTNRQVTWTPEQGLEIIALLRKLNEDNGVTVITATHDTKMLDVSDRIFHMVDGRVSKIESRDEIDLHVGRLDGEEVG